jgi:hypothetical protein
MKYTIFILFFLVTIFISGQTKDRRAELNIIGRVNELSVSPDEKIWLVTAVGNTYYTNSIDSNWHYGNLLSVKNWNEHNLKQPNLDRISFFNKDTAFISGYFNYSDSIYKKNGYYLTKNAGKTWERLNYGGDSWIYNVFVNKYGKAWMGGSSGEIFYSTDFGHHWELLNSPYNSSTRMHYIFMKNNLSGISGSLENNIFLTDDNWKTSKKIDTPFDQKKYSNESGHSDNRIEKVILWNNRIVVNQRNKIYYTVEQEIDWKPFPIKIIDFELDTISNKLLAVTADLRVVCFSTPNEYHYLSEKKLSSFPIDIKVVNSSLFILTNDYEVFKVSSKGIQSLLPFTTDHPISEPKIIKHGNKLKWGMDGDQLYLSENNNEWYREYLFDFNIFDFKLINDSIAIFWDGIKDNYIYSLKDHVSSKYTPVSPLKTFLESPVKSFTINSGSRGCFHNMFEEVTYNIRQDNVLSTESYLELNSRDKKTKRFNNELIVKELNYLLNTINDKPSVLPRLIDFHITNKDKKNFLSLVNQQLKNKSNDDFFGRKKIDEKFYMTIPNRLDTLNDTILHEVLYKSEGIISTTRNWFTIQIINSKNDTINISRNYYLHSSPWNLPWEFEYKGSYFNCYNIELSKFINSAVPDEFEGKSYFDNRILIMQIADYLYNKE